jgi:hypothetical protein
MGSSLQRPKPDPFRTVALPDLMSAFSNLHALEAGVVQLNLTDHSRARHQSLY